MKITIIMGGEAGTIRFETELNNETGAIYAMAENAVKMYNTLKANEEDEEE